MTVRKVTVEFYIDPVDYELEDTDKVAVDTVAEMIMGGADLPDADVNPEILTKSIRIFCGDASRELSPGDG